MSVKPEQLKVGRQTTRTNKVSEAIEKSGQVKQQQSTATPEEIEIRQATLKTQGRKGCKGPRINMLFAPENHQFVKTMSKVRSISMSQFLDEIISEYKENHKEQYEFLEILKNL